MISDRVENLAIDLTNQVTTATKYDCVEGSFLAGVNANGCGGGDTATLCAEAASPYAGAAVSGADIVLSWVFQFDSTDALNDTAHLKYLYVDSDGDKVGSLGGWDIAIGGDGERPLGTPEPSTAALMVAGLCLIWIGSVRARQKR